MRAGPRPSCRKRATGDGFTHDVIGAHRAFYKQGMVARLANAYLVGKPRAWTHRCVTSGGRIRTRCSSAVTMTPCSSSVP